MNSIVKIVSIIWFLVMLAVGITRTDTQYIEILYNTQFSYYIYTVLIYISIVEAAILSHTIDLIIVRITVHR